MRELFVYTLCILLIVFWGKICSIMQIAVHKTVNKNYQSTECPVAGWIAVQAVFILAVFFFTWMMQLICLMVLHMFDAALLRVDTNSIPSLIMDFIAPAVIYWCAIVPVSNFVVSCNRTLRLTDTKSAKTMRRLHVISLLAYAVLIACMYSEFTGTTVLQAINDITIKR